MSYPMTFQRLVNRNGLQGDYGAKLVTVNTSLDIAPRVENDGSDPKGLLLRLYANNIDAANSRWSLVVGDLRRLERDAVDENPTGIAGYLAQRTGIEADVIAAVLKEFIAW